MSDTYTRAVAEIAERSDFWFGPSGSRVTGDAVATHAEAAAHLMRDQNWDPQLYGVTSGRQLRDALRSTEMDGHGTADTQAVARDCMELILRKLTSAPYVDYEVWTEHPHRRLTEVLDLLSATASLARVYGPRS